jgi:phenylacetate-CoA ligase
MNKIYVKLLKSVMLPFADRVMSTKIMHYYHQIHRMRLWSNIEVENWQNKNLKRLINHAYNNTKYYRQLFDEKSLRPDDVNSIKDLDKIPILTKKDIIANFDNLIPNNISKIKYKSKATGGSSGDPLNYLLDNNSWSFTNANNIINWERTSYLYGNKYLALGSYSINVGKKTSFKHKFYYFLKSKIGVSGINMSDEVCKLYLNKINKENIKYIYGYASAIYMLAKYSLENKIPVSVNACFPTSEVLTSLYRTTIIEAFNCWVVNCYGANDGGITAYEHEKECFEVGYNCLVRTKKTESTHGLNAALITDLLNYAMPLINYQLGDEIIIDNSHQYAFNGQVISNIAGRTSDVIKLENGSVLTGPGFTVLFKDFPIKAYKVKKTGYNKVLCQVKKKNNFSKMDEEIIISSVRMQTGKKSVVEIEYISEFDLSKSGKKDYFISD